MTRTWVAAILLASSAHTASAETIILWSPEAKACGYNNYRKGYQYERLESPDPKFVTERLSTVVAESKAAGASYVWTQKVAPNSCVAIAFMDKALGSCSWRTFTWKTGKDEAAARSAVQTVISGERGVTGSAIQEVLCAGPAKPPASRDTAIGVRG